jgi:hypothetical protein
VNFAAKAEKLLDLAATIPGVKLPTTPDVVAPAEERVMKSTFLISVRVSK